MIGGFLKSSFAPPLLIILLILIGNFIYLGHITNPNPLNTRSGLSNSQQSGFLRGENNIDPNDGFGTQALGKQAVEDIVHGKLPWWNYNEQIGAPLAGDMQSASFFPPTLLLGLSNGMIYFHITLEIIAGLSTYYLLLRLGLRKLSAFVGGTAFALSAVFVWFWSANTNPVAFLPLLILGIEGAYERAKTKSKGGWFVITGALALSIYAGFPEVTFLDGLLAGLWAVTRLYKMDATIRWAYIKKILGGLTFGLLIAAPLLLAFADYLPYANVGTHSGGITVSVNAVGVPGLIMPYIYGPIFGLNSYDISGNLTYLWSNVGGYVTILTFFLAALSFIDIRRISKNRAIKVLLAAWAIVIVLRIYGFPGLPTLLSKLPGIGQITIYRYSPPALAFVVIILMSFGIDYILSVKRTQNRQLNRKIYLIASAALVVIFAVLPIAFHQRASIVGSHHQTTWLLASAGWAVISVISASGLIILFLRKNLSRTSAGYLLVSLVLVDSLVMFIIPQLSAPRSTIINIKPVSFLQQNLGNYRFYSMGPIMPNYGSYFDIASIDTNNEPIPKNWSNYISNSLDSNANPLVFVGLPSNSLNPAGLTPAEAFVQNLENYEYVGVKYLVTNNGTLDQAEINAAQIKSVFQDSTSTAIIYKLPHPDPYFQLVKGSCSLLVQSKTELTSSCQTPSILLRRELYMPGWSGTVNGHKVIVSASGPLFQSIKLPAGTDRVNFQYEPRGLTISVICMAAGAIAILGYYCVMPLFVPRSLKKNNARKR